MSGKAVRETLGFLGVMASLVPDYLSQRDRSRVGSVEHER